MDEMVEWGDRKCDDIQIVESEGVTIQIVFCHVPNPFRMVNCMHGSASISFAGKTQPPMSSEHLSYVLWDGRTVS